MPGNKGNKEPVRIVVTGKTGSGKSALANVLLGRNRFKCSALGSSVTTTTEADEGDCNGSAVKVVDTPGFFDTNVDAEVNKREIIRCLAKSEKGPHVFLYCTEIGRFTEEDNKTFRRVKFIFGDSVTNYTWIVFTKKDKLDNEGITEKAYIESAPPDLKKVLNEVKNKHIFIDSTSDNLKPALNSLSTIINSVKKENFYTIKNYKNGLEILKRLIIAGKAYEKAHTEWKSKRTDIIKHFGYLETYLNGVARDVRISKIAGRVGEIVGSTMAIAGLIAALFTFGASVALTAVGAGIGIAGAATGGGATIADTVIGKKRRKEIDTLLKEDRKLLEELDKIRQTLQQILLEAFSNNQIECIIKYVLTKSATRAKNKTFANEVHRGLNQAYCYLLQLLNFETSDLFPGHNTSPRNTSPRSPNVFVCAFKHTVRVFAVDTDGRTYIIPPEKPFVAATDDPFFVKKPFGAAIGDRLFVSQLPLNVNAIIQGYIDFYSNKERNLGDVIHDLREKLKMNMESYDKDQYVLNIFVDEVRKFIDPEK